MKQKIIIVLLSFLLGIPCALLTSSSTTMFIINVIFFSSILILMASGMIIICQGGMFKAFINSFKRFYKHSSKLNEYVEETEAETTIKNKQIVTQQSSLPLPLIVVGGGLFLFSYLLSILIVL